LALQHEAASFLSPQVFAQSLAHPLPSLAPSFATTALSADFFTGSAAKAGAIMAAANTNDNTMANFFISKKFYYLFEFKISEKKDVFNTIVVKALLKVQTERFCS
jgi:hypothetical protein